VLAATHQVNRVAALAASAAEMLAFGQVYMAQIVRNAQALGAALDRRGRLLAFHGNYGRAIKDFDELIRLRPDAEAFNNRCWARAIIGDLASALNDCNMALQLRPRYADAFDSRAMINLKSGQLSKAIADYDAALRIDSKRANSLYGRGIAKIKNDNAAGGNLDIVAAKSIQADIAEEFAGYGIR